MAGVVVILAVLVLLPVLVCMGSAVAAAAVGSLLHRDGEQRHRGSELLELDA